MSWPEPRGTVTTPSNTALTPGTFNGSISATIRSAKPRYRNRVSVAASDSKSSPAASMIDRQTC